MPLSLTHIVVPPAELKKGSTDYVLTAGQTFEVIAGDDKTEVEVPAGEIWTVKVRVVVEVADA